MHNEQRNQRLSMANTAMGTAQYQNMMRGIPNGVGVAPNDLKRAAAMNNRGNPYVFPVSPVSECTADLRDFAQIATEIQWRICK
jgi:hypothetical protein